MICGYANTLGSKPGKRQDQPTSSRPSRVRRSRHCSNFPLTLFAPQTLFSYLYGPSECVDQASQLALTPSAVLPGAGESVEVAVSGRDASPSFTAAVPQPEA